MRRPRGAGGGGPASGRPGLLRAGGALALLGLGLWGVHAYAVWALRKGAEGVGSVAGGAARLARRGEQQNFIAFFSGHTGTSPFLDALGAWPEVLVPGFEPLEHSKLSSDDKLEYMRAVWSLPTSPGRFPAWKHSLERHSATYRWMSDPPVVETFEDVKGKSVAGFKMRPFVRTKGRQGEVEFSTRRRPIPWLFPSLERASPDGHMYPGMLRLAPRELRRVLGRHNVTVVVMKREDQVAEALSWYRAREAGASQFTSEASREQKVTVDLGRFAQWLRFVASANLALDAAVDFFGRPTISLLYEDFRKDPQSALAPLARHWGLEIAPTSSGRFHKTGPSSLRDIVANFDEFCGLVRSDAFARLGGGDCDAP